MNMVIKRDSLDDGHVIQLLEEHLADMYATSPPESVHALDVAALKSPEITFYSAWLNGQVAGCVAIKKLDAEHAEIKSMRTNQNARRRGVARQLLEHLILQAKQLGYQCLSVETGSQDFFKPARTLYEAFGFEYCAPFADYKPDPHSKFMTREI